MKEGVLEKGEDISIVQKRLEILWSVRFTDRTEVEEAVRIQERLSKKGPDGWSDTEEIWRWRDISNATSNGERSWSSRYSILRNSFKKVFFH